MTIIKARNLPVMDKLSDESHVKGCHPGGTTNAYCLVRYGKMQEGSRPKPQVSSSREKKEEMQTPTNDSSVNCYATCVCPNTLCPEWNEQAVFTECDDEALQEKYFEVTVRSGEKLIGTVVIDLSPLL